jgi:hypothetical protein
MAVVFISHRSVDSTVANRLGKDLATLGHTVHLDEWDLHAGDSIVEWMQRGLSDASYLILCYSEAGVDSPWMSREWMSALARQLNGEGIRVIPVRLPGGIAPAILADIKYADLASNWASGIRTLNAALR